MIHASTVKAPLKLRQALVGTWTYWPEPLNARAVVESGLPVTRVAPVIVPLLLPALSRAVAPLASLKRQ